MIGNRIESENLLNFGIDIKIFENILHFRLPENVWNLSLD